MDYDSFKSDDLCGSCTLRVDDLQLVCKTDEIIIIIIIIIIINQSFFHFWRPVGLLRTDGWTGKADLYRPKSSVNMISSSDSDLPLACMVCVCVHRLPTHAAKKLGEIGAACSSVEDGKGRQALLLCSLIA